MRVSELLYRFIHHWAPGAALYLVGKQLSGVVPFARLLNLRVDNVDAKAASVSMEASPQLMNHIGTLHAGAIFTSCETFSGAALAGAFLPELLRLKFVLREANLAYLKPTNGRLVSHAQLARPASEVLEELQRNNRVDISIEVEAFAEVEQQRLLVARGTFTWHLRNPQATRP